MDNLYLLDIIFLGSILMPFPPTFLYGEFEFPLSEDWLLLGECVPKWIYPGGESLFY